jgi:hypothetical protein
MLKNSTLELLEEETVPLVDLGIDVLQVILVELSDREVNCLRTTSTGMLQTVDVIRTPSYWEVKARIATPGELSMDRCWFECYCEIKYGYRSFYALGRYCSMEHIQQIIENQVDYILGQDSRCLHGYCQRLQSILEHILEGITNTNDAEYYQSFVDWGWEQMYATEEIQDVFEKVFKTKSALSLVVAADNNWNILIANLHLLQEIVQEVEDKILITVGSTGLQFQRKVAKYAPSYRLLVRAAQSTDLAHYLLVRALMPPESLPEPPEIVDQVIERCLYYATGNLSYYAREYPEATQKILSGYIQVPQLRQPPWEFAWPTRARRSLCTLWWSSLNEEERQIQRDYALTLEDLEPSLWAQLAGK